MTPEQLSFALHHAETFARKGDFVAARLLCEQVFKHDPGVLGALQTYTAITRMTPDDPVLARLRQFARQTASPDAIRSQVQFMLGKGLDDIGDHPGAFEAFLHANALRDVPFDAPMQERLAKASLHAVQHLDIAPLAPEGPRMVFVLGMPRAGSSVLAQMLGAHPAITSLGEMTALGQAVRGINPSLPRFIAGLTPEHLARVRQSYLAAVAPQAAGARVLVEKMPENYWLGWLIPLLFPDALIVEPRRPALATCWSCFRNDFAQGHGYSTDFPTLWAHYHRYLRMAEAWRARAPAQWQVIDLNALVTKPEAALAPALAALSLDWDAAMARPDKTCGQVQTLSKWQARQRLDRAIADGWQAYRPLILAQWGKALDPAPQP